MTSETFQLASNVLHEARERHVYLATAESLTGGMLSARLVDVPGASDVFVGGVVAYATPLKHSLLSVDQRRLDQVGAVDPLVAMHMARGARTRCSQQILGQVHEPEFGLATTGVAGPDPDQVTGLPAGTVFIGVSSPRGDRSVQLQLTGDRTAIREATVNAALAELLAELRAHSSEHES
ncbi:MAG: CinA family protein [Canibacter sp.]